MSILLNPPRSHSQKSDNQPSPKFNIGRDAPDHTLAATFLPACHSKGATIMGLYHHGVIKVGDDYADGDFSLLVRHLNLLDFELTKINAAIKESADPESDGLCDAGEYFIGHGFVAIQRYLTSTCAGLGIARSEAFREPPIVNSNLTFAEAMNAGANYWKHMEEWLETLCKGKNEIIKSNSLKTLEKLEMAVEWKEYTCANLLAFLEKRKLLELSPLLPRIAEWRNNLMNKTRQR